VTTSDGTQLQAMRGNPGACPTTLDPEGTLTYSQIDQTTWTFEGVPVGSSCLSFFAISGNGTSSPPTTVEVTHAARPVG
jgi:hypothetical protein